MQYIAYLSWACEIASHALHHQSILSVLATFTLDVATYESEGCGCPPSLQL